MRKLILIRHGETRKNLLKKIHSESDPEELNNIGRGQMIKVAEALKDFVPLLLFASDTKRTLASAKIISEILDVPVSKINGLQERNWGIYSGKSWLEVEKILKKMSLDERYNFIPERGESWKIFEERLVKSIKHILSVSEDNVCVLTHGGTIRALMPFLLSKTKEESFKYDFDNGSITVFEFDGNNFQKVVINDVSHLR